MPSTEDTADLAWTVTVGCLTEVLGDVAALEPETETADLGLDLAVCSRLSALLVERAGGFISPAAIVSCATVEDLSSLVERIMGIVAGKAR